MATVIGRVVAAFLLVASGSAAGREHLGKYDVPDVSFSLEAPFAPETVKRIGVDPLRQGVLFVVTDRGMVFRSIDGGVSFRSIPPGGTKDAQTIVAVPSSPTTLLVGGGTGPYLSVDDGAKWAPLPCEGCYG